MPILQSEVDASAPSSLVRPSPLRPTSRLRTAWQAAGVALRSPDEAADLEVEEAVEIDLAATDEPAHGKLILLVDEKAFTRECILKCLTQVCTEITVVAFSSVQECVDSGLAVSRTCVVLYNLHGDAVMEPEIVENLGQLKTSFDPHPIVILSDVDRSDCVQEAFQHGARGYIPTTSTTLDVAAEVIRLVRVGGTFMPATTAGDMRGRGRNGAGEFDGQFTPRQQAVLNHLRQGKANKIIAHELQMSESTVKVHVRNIMKKMKATNRTEVAFRAQGFKTHL